MSDLMIGVLALQGAFAKHVEVIKSLGANVTEVRKPRDLLLCDGLVIPGGESTTMMKHIDFIQLRDPLVQFSKTKPVFGTCAGLILMSKKIHGDKMLPFQLLDVEVERNAFGRQADSFNTHLDLQFKLGTKKTIPGVFIRAPRIRNISSHVQILACFEGEPVLIKQKNHLGASFHPELTADDSIHAYFLDLVAANKKSLRLL